MAGSATAHQVADGHTGVLLEQLDAIVRDGRGLTDGLTQAQFNWRPEPRRWSVAQCLDHVTRTLRLYPAEIERMFGESRQRSATQKPYREGWVSRWVVSGMEPPPRMRIRTTKRVEPPVELAGEQVVGEFEAELAGFRELISRADGLSLRHARMRSPFAPILKFTLGQVLAMNLAHARRHLWQARQVTQHANFPR